MMAGSSAQSPPIARTVDEWLGGGTRRRCGLLCALSIFSSVLMLPPRRTRRPSIISCPHTLPLPVTTIEAPDDNRGARSSSSTTAVAACSLYIHVYLRDHAASLCGAHLHRLDWERTHDGPDAEAKAEADTPLTKCAEPAARAVASLSTSPASPSPVLVCVLAGFGGEPELA
jgi:hypothetical protein